MTIRKELLSELLASMDSHEDFLGPDGLLNELTGALISRVMNAEMDELQAWRTRPLDEVYPVLILDAIVLKIRVKGHVPNKAAYVAMGIGVDGTKDLLGI